MKKNKCTIWILGDVDQEGSESFARERTIKKWSIRVGLSARGAIKTML